MSQAENVYDPELKKFIEWLKKQDAHDDVDGDAFFKIDPEKPYAKYMNKLKQRDKLYKQYGSDYANKYDKLKGVKPPKGFDPKKGGSYGAY